MDARRGKMKRSFIFIVIFVFFILIIPTKILTKIPTKAKDAKALVDVDNISEISVQSFSAVGDGITDDTQAIQQAINYALEHDIRTVKIDNGIFVCNQLKIDGHDLTIAGNGTLLYKNSTNGFWVTKDSYNIEFKDFKSISNYNEGTSSNAHIVVSAESKITGQPYSNLEFYAHDIKVSNCEFTGGVFGFAASSTKNITIENCKFNGNVYVPEALAGGYGILLQSCPDVNIENCDFIASEKSRHGIYVSVDRRKTDKINCKNVFIENCTFDAEQITNTDNKEFYSSNTSPICVRTVDTISIKNCQFKNAVCCVSMNAADGDISNAIIENIIVDNPVYNTGKSETRYLFNFLGGSVFSTECSIRNVYLYNIPENYRNFSSITNSEVHISDCEMGNLRIICNKGSRLYFEDTFVEVEKDVTKTLVFTQQKATEINLNKTNITMNVGESETLISNINPQSVTKKKVEWESSDSNIATVDQNGKVTGINPGKVLITAETTDGTNISAICNVTIEAKKLNNIEVTTEPTKTEYIEGENFDKSGMKIVAIYNDNTSKEITDYIITDGDNLIVGKPSVTISYTEGNITKTVEQQIKVLAKLKVDFGDYNELNETGKRYIENVEPKTTLGEFTNKIKTNGKVQIFKDNTEITNNETKISTGMRLKISLKNQAFEYTIIVKGDCNGDGECDLKDILQVNKHRLNKAQLADEYLLAGDVNNDITVNIKDLLQINKFRLGKIEKI